MREREDVDELGGNGGGGIGERDGRLPNSLVMEVDDNQVLVDQSIISRFEGGDQDSGRSRTRNILNFGARCIINVAARR